MPAATKIEVSSALLRRLHSLHQQAADLTAQIERGPRQVAAAEAIVAKSQSKLDAANDAVAKARRVAEGKEGQMKTREEKVRSLESQLNTAASNKEFSLLKEQIAAERQANDCLSDEILEVLEQIDTLGVDVDAAEAELKENQDAKAERQSNVEKRLIVVREDLSDVQSKLVEEEPKIPAGMRALYDRLVAANGPDAMSAMEGNSCSQCNQVMRTQLIDQLQMGILMQCPSCHALLYQPAK